MPRIHGGNNQHRGSSHSRRAASSSSSKDNQRSSSVAKTATNILVNKMDIDVFEEFSYGEASQNEQISFADDAQQQRRQQKQQKFTLEDTSSEEDEEDLPETSYKSSKSCTTRKTASKKKKPNNVDVDPNPKRRTPTVSSPKITLSNIAKNESSTRPPPKNNNSNNNASSKWGTSKKGPIGKPIKPVLGGKKSNNEENYDNDAEQSDEGKQLANRSRRKKQRAMQQQQKKQEPNVSFTSDSNKNGDDKLTNGTFFTNNEGVDIISDTTPFNKGRTTQIQVLPLRAIAIDNRTLPRFTADSTSRKSFFEKLPDFLHGMMDKGVLQPNLPRSNHHANIEGASIIASFVHGTKSSQMALKEKINRKDIGLQVEQLVAPRASFLLEDESGGRVANKERSEWLSEFLNPINHGLESAVRLSQDVATGFGAQDSWRYFGDLGKQHFCCNAQST